MTNCCRKCSKIFCENRDKIEDCKDCISFVWLTLQQLDKKLKEEGYDKL